MDGEIYVLPMLIKETWNSYYIHFRQSRFQNKENHQGKHDYYVIMQVSNSLRRYQNLKCVYP